ncbi:GGDEF domain-containing protein [Sphingomonas canadensis]|nr:diguanylate cyclase [Sphingomonas canadensis]
MPGAPALAQAGVAGHPVSVCVLRDDGAMSAARLIREPGRFDCASTQHALGPGDYWALSEEIGERSTPERPLSIRFASVWQKSIALDILYEDGRIVRVPADPRGLTPYIQLGAVAEIRLPPAQARVMRLLWHVEGSANLRGILLGARISTAAESVEANLKMAAMYAAFGGLALALIIYNLALWGALRHRFQLWYCAMTAGLLAYAFSSSGALAWVWPDIANNDRMRLNYLWLGLMGGAALMFARTFFEERVYTGRLGRVAEGVAVLIAAAGILVYLAAPVAIHAADLIFTSIFVGLTCVVVPTLWRAWRLRSNYLWLFAIAWGAPILTAILRMLGNIHLLPWNFWLDNSTVLSMCAEAVLSSLAIAYRIKLLSKERDAAMRGEEAALRLAETDPLTGLLNRRAFLEKAIGRPGDQMLQIADLDHFKSVNETLGHDGGDEVLRVFARVLRQVAPPGALVARMGGEEFAILSARDEAVEPEIVLARLRATRMPFDLQITTSVGTCCGPIGTEVDWKALYRGADSALFEAKSAGRDRVRNAPAREAA